MPDLYLLLLRFPRPRRVDTAAEKEKVKIRNYLGGVAKVRPLFYHTGKENGSDKGKSSRALSSGGKL